MKKRNNKNVRFVSIRGRIVPIIKKEAKAAGDILNAANRTGTTAKVAGLTAASFGGLYVAGRLQRKSLKSFGKKATVLNRGAKLLKFGAKFAPAMAIGTALIGLDRATKADERSKHLDLSGTPTPARIALGAVGAYASIRLGKRFEKFGLRGGRFPWKLKDI